MMKERPIPFRGREVRAIRDGRKTMTRRVVRLRAGESAHEGGDGSLHAVSNTTWGDCIERVIQSPYGVPGDMLWVRETWAENIDGDVIYRADNGIAESMIDRWRPSIFMPRWASRLTRRITSIRVERVQEISFADARAEGCDPDFIEYMQCDNDDACTGKHNGEKWHFVRLWDSINADRGFGWDTNPWVWVIGFEHMETDG
jgi:hypothetical protein